jgi:hypothetical protein
MDLETAKQIFAVRFYRWAVQDFAREVEQGFPLISSIKGNTSRMFIEVWDSLSAEEREILAVALVKRFHPEACALTAEFMSGKEKGMVERYLSLTSQWLAGDAWVQGPAKTLSRSKCASAIKRELKKVLGTPHFWKGEPNDPKYYTHIGPWLILTHVSARQPPWYFHRIIATGHIYLREATSIFGWLGIGGRLAWDLILDDDDASGAAISMATICGHFISAAPKLLEGLSHDDVPEEVPVEKVEDMRPRLVKKPREQ